MACWRGDEIVNYSESRALFFDVAIFYQHNSTSNRSKRLGEAPCGCLSWSPKSGNFQTKVRLSRSCLVCGSFGVHLLSVLLTKSHLVLFTVAFVVLRRVDAMMIMVDDCLQGTPPSRVVVGSALFSYLGMKFISVGTDFHHQLRNRGLLRIVFEAAKSLPILKDLVSCEKAKLIAKLDKDLRKKIAAKPPRMIVLPYDGLSSKEIMSEADCRRAKDTSHLMKASRMSGAVYMADQEHFDLLCSIYSSFVHANPLHADAFPSVTRMEAEVVSMTASLLGGCSATNPDVCGLMTSGGTESILTAIRATRDYMRVVRHVRRPEMIVAVSAHAAVYKAAEYFNIQIVRVPVDKDFRMDVDATARAIRKNTILIYASAPGYPHGVIDPVEKLAALAKKNGVCLHVDACLGGFVLPFISSSNRTSSELFDFRAPGVTSMSADTHKYGLSQKGSSVVLYASALLRQYQYTAVMDWSGGLYISPSQPGSRPGGLIAQSWASLLHLGRKGFQMITKRICNAAVLLRAGISSIDGLQVLGSDVTMVVAWGSTDPLLDIYVVNDIMITKGWHLSVLHTPAALHMCITPANIECVPELLSDLKAAVDEARNSNDGCISGGKAPIYGLAGALPDRDLVGDILKDVQDLMLRHV